MLLIEEVAEYLHEKSIAVYAPTGTTGNLFLNNLPPAEGLIIGLFDTSGVGSDSALPFDNLGLQVIIRGADTNPLLPAGKAWEIYNALQFFGGKRFCDNGAWIVNCVAQSGPPYRFGNDENGRPQFTLNFIIDRENLDRRNAS